MPPTPRDCVSRCIPGGCPPCRSCDRGRACRVPASCSHPTSAWDHLGAARCGQRLSPERTVPRQDTSRTAGAVAGTPHAASATCDCSHGSPPTRDQDAAACDAHSIFTRSASGSRGACRASRLCGASPHLLRQGTKKAAAENLRRRLIRYPVFPLSIITYFCKNVKSNRVR